MNKRFIAFGCSFTNYDWATWADIIGVNFDDYLNFGKPSGSNMDTMRRFITMHDKYKFNKDDLRIRSFEMNGHTFKVKVPLTAEFEAIQERSKNPDQVLVEKYYSELTKEFVGKKDEIPDGWKKGRVMK